MADLSALKSTVAELSAVKDEVVAALQSVTSQAEIDEINDGVQSSIVAMRAALPQPPQG